MKALLSRIGVAIGEATLTPLAHSIIADYTDKASCPNLILCYRYFKEIRNAQVHSGGIANQTAVDAYNAFLPVSGKAGLGRKGELWRHLKVCSPDNDFPDIGGTSATQPASTAPRDR